MKKFTIGALRPLNNASLQSHLKGASGLVRRTLAQHGLGPSSDDQELATKGDLKGNLAASVRTLMTMPISKSLSRMPIPKGAEFRHGQYACAEGKRNYLTYVPSGSKNGVTGLVVMLHGCTQNAEDFALGTQMNSHAEKHNFIVAYPEQSRGDNAQSCWNWFSPKDQTRDYGEPAIIAGMTRLVMAEFDIPSERTFVAGLSAGGAMAVILGKTYPDIYSAVGAHSGLPHGAAKNVQSAFAAMAGRGRCAVTSGLSEVRSRTIVFHGSSDSTVHPSNSEQIARLALGTVPAQTVETRHSGETSGRTHKTRLVSLVDGVVLSEHWIIDGLGHAWSGGHAHGSYTDTAGPDATAEMGRFFFSQNS